MLFTARQKANQPTTKNDEKSPSSPVVASSSSTIVSSQQQQSTGSPPVTEITQSSNGDPTELQKKGKETEHFLINFFIKKENLKASLLLEHLSRYNDHTNGYKGCWQFLCNKLFELELSDVDFYLPQLLNIYVRRVIEHKSPLERYFLEKSLESMHFAIRCCWLLDAQIQQLQMMQTTASNGPTPTAYSEDAPLTTIERCIYLRSMVEQVCVNQAIPQWYIPRSISDSDDKSQLASFVKSNVFSKQRRLNYFNDEMEFWNFLTDLSTRLKAYPVGPIRKQRMKLELENLNKCIPSGCYIPQCSTDDVHCRIVRIDASECIVFSTKERVPYLVVVEVLEDPFTVSQPMLAHMVHGEFSEERIYNQRITCSVLNPENVENTPRGKTPKSKKNAILGRVNSLPSNIDDIDFESTAPNVLNNTTKSNIVRKVLSSSHTLDDSDISAELPPSDILKPPAKKEDDVTVLTAHKKRVEKDLGGDDEYIMVDKDRIAEADRNALLYAVFGESWEEKKQRIQRISPFGMAPGWNMKSFIVKSNDDIRQEQFAMQLIKMFQKIFLEEKLPVYLRTYHITVTNADSGIIEAVTDTVSIDSLKKKFPNFTSLKDYFIKVYGVPESNRFRKAQQNFIESLAGYCVVCYLLQIKDRHNGNILIDREGNIVHIDFGFLLGNSPGGVGFESAPFKLTTEMMDVMGGPDGEMFNNYFRPLVYMCFQAATKHKEKILSIIRMMSGINFPCFLGDPSAATTLRELDKRFNSHLDEIKFAQWVRSLVDESIDNWWTKRYDDFQRVTNGIL
jgi:hypothetical protein